jgi:hypothetical protein
LPVSAPPLIEGLQPVFLAEEVAAASDGRYAVRTIWDFCERRMIPFVRTSRGRLGILDGDDQVILTGGPAEGPARLREALQHVDRLDLGLMSRLLRVCTRTLQRLIESGELPATKRAGRWGMSRDEFIAWILDRRVPSKWEKS